MIPRNTEFPTDRVFSIQCFGERMADGTYCDYGRLQLYVSKDGTMRDARFLTELGYRFTSPSAFPFIINFAIDNNGFINVKIVQTCDNRVL